MENYDVCILGGGAAGLTAGIYSGRYGLKTVLISKNIGGTANLAYKVENYPGFQGSGKELMNKFYEQAKKFGCEFLSQEILSITKNKKKFLIELEDKKIAAKSLIVALGTEKKKLGIPGEAEFLGKGVSYCATCDANFFKNKDVAVIGGSNSAAKTALLLADVARKVFIIYRGEELTCEKVKINRIKERDNIDIMCGAVPLRILGSNKVDALEVDFNGKKKISLQGVFVEIGSIPVIELVNKLGIKTDKNNFILADEEMKTNVKGVFAAGDIVKSKLKQIIVAASQGAIAAKSVREFLEK